jgi:hypothetical protein
MNKLILLTLLIDTVLLSAEKSEPYFINKIEQGSIRWVIRSNYDLSSYSPALKNLVFTGKAYTLDLRSIEKSIIALHQKSLSNPWYITHRGKLCFLAGASITLLPLFYALQLSMSETLD